MGIWKDAYSASRVRIHQGLPFITISESAHSGFMDDGLT